RVGCTHGATLRKASRMARKSRAGARSLPGYEMLPDRRAVWPHLADPSGCVLRRGQHRRRVRPAQEEGVSSLSRHRSIVTYRGRVRIAVLAGRWTPRRRLGGSQRPPVPCPIPYVAALPGPRPVATSTILHQPPPSSTLCRRFVPMSEDLPL